MKYVAAREDGHRLYFRIAYYGVCLFVISLVLLTGLYLLCRDWTVFQAITRFFAAGLRPLVKDPSQTTAQLGFILICLGAIPLGRWLPWVLNKLSKSTNEEALWKAAEQNELEELLLEALVQAKSISITMSSSKVYVGLVLSTMEPRTDRKVIAMLPLMSGYRSEEGRVHFTTFYDKQIYEAREEADNGDFRLVLPIDKMLSISFFDAQVYAKFSAAGAAPPDVDPTRAPEPVDGRSTPPAGLTTEDGTPRH